MKIDKLSENEIEKDHVPSSHLNYKILIQALIHVMDNNIFLWPVMWANKYLIRMNLPPNQINEVDLYFSKRISIIIALKLELKSHTLLYIYIYMN